MGEIDHPGRAAADSPEQRAGVVWDVGLPPRIQGVDFLKLLIAMISGVSLFWIGIILHSNLAGLGRAAWLVSVGVPLLIVGCVVLAVGRYEQGLVRRWMNRALEAPRLLDFVAVLRDPPGPSVLATNIRGLVSRVIERPHPAGAVATIRLMNAQEAGAEGLRPARIVPFDVSFEPLALDETEPAVRAMLASDSLAAGESASVADDEETRSTSTRAGERHDRLAAQIRRTVRLAPSRGALVTKGIEGWWLRIARTARRSSSRRRRRSFCCVRGRARCRRRRRRWCAG